MSRDASDHQVSKAQSYIASGISKVGDVTWFLALLCLGCSCKGQIRLMQGCREVSFCLLCPCSRGSDQVPTARYFVSSFEDGASEQAS